MKNDLSGHIAIVTGAAQGLGRTIAETLAESGAQVHAVDVVLPEDVASSALKFHRLDVVDSTAVAEFAETIGAPVHTLVNNAGITRDRTLLKMSPAEWLEVIAVNLTGAFNMIHAVAPLMSGENGGAIVNITSINGIRGKIGQGNYAASKAGLIGLTRTAARELGRKNIRVNAVAPGMVMTEMARQLPPEILERALAETALGRLAEPADIAAAVLFLVGDAANAITGQVLQVDAGQLIA